MDEGRGKEEGDGQMEEMCKGGSGGDLYCPLYGMW